MRGTSTEISRIADSRSFVRLRVCVGVCPCVFVLVFVHEIGNGSCRGHKLKDGFKINKQVAWQIGRSQDSQLCRCLLAEAGEQGVRRGRNKKRKKKTQLAN